MSFKEITPEIIEKLESADYRNETCEWCEHATRADNKYWTKICTFYSSPILVNSDYSTCFNFKNKNREVK
jgi:hypothetical protein